MLDTLLHKGKRNRMIRELSAKYPYGKEVLDAMGTVPRHLFVDGGLDHLAYEDRPLPIGAKQTISQPSTVAMQSHLLGAGPEDKVLEVGTGCGYQTAVLAQLGARVFSIERQGELYLRAKQNLARIGCEGPRLFLGDGYAGLPEFAPFKGIVVTCGAPEIPRELLLQLEIGGRMVIPVGSGQQQMLVITRVSEREFRRDCRGECSFVPMLEGVNQG